MYFYSSAKEKIIISEVQINVEYNGHKKTIDQKNLVN